MDHSELHTIWHVLLLASTLLAAAALAILLLAPLIFEGRAPGLERARPLLLGLVAAALVLLALEWLVVHRRSL